MMILFFWVYTPIIFLSSTYIGWYLIHVKIVLLSPRSFKFTLSERLRPLTKLKKVTHEFQW
jgi:hypothetical protein